MHDSQALRSIMLPLIAEGAMPQPVEYWRRHLMCVAGFVTKAQTEEVLFALEDAGLVESAIDLLTVRRFSATPKGIAAALQIKG